MKSAVILTLAGIAVGTTIAAVTAGAGGNWPGCIGCAATAAAALLLAEVLRQ